MKLKDYYQILGLELSATPAEIKSAYRKLARQFHPDVSKDPKGEERFKEIAEAYATLKDAEKRAEYDNVGRHDPSENIRPPPDWQQRYGQAAQTTQSAESGAFNTLFEDLDLSDFLAAFSTPRQGARRSGRHVPQTGQNHEVKTTVTLEQIYAGAEIEISVNLPQFDALGVLRHSARTFHIRIPKNTADGQRLRLPGKGAQSRNGGAAGDLIVVLEVASHAVYRVNKRDLTIDLTLAPWEAVLGTRVHIPTLGGMVDLKIPAGTSAGCKFRLAKRGLPGLGDEQGDLYAKVQIDVPTNPTARERELFMQLAAESGFRPHR
ncbi:MAG: DnaJ C-terminal domain-containing protein [Pseudomonadota bacterium]